MWGHVDFTCLPFLPRIMNAEQLAATKRIQAYQGVRFQRAKQIHEGKTLEEIDGDGKKKGKKKAAAPQGEGPEPTLFE